MRQRDKILSLLSIAARGGNIKSGEFQTEDAVKRGAARLVIVANDASDNTKKKFSDMCDFYGTDFKLYSDRESLGGAIGKDYRASLCIVEDGLAQKVLALVNEEEGSKEKLI